MKNTICKTLLACAVTAAVAFSANASAAVYPDFEVNAAIGGADKTFTADKMTGNYVELINLTKPGAFDVSLFWYAGSFVADDGETALTTKQTGLGDKYGIYALYKASGTVSNNGVKTTFNFATGSGTLEVWLDKNADTTYKATVAKDGFDTTGTTGDILLAKGTPLSGQGTLDPSLSTCGGQGINCGSFGSTTTFVLTEDGSKFFVKPTPFYPLSFQSGQLNNFDVSGRQKINGSLDVVFDVPEPTSVALLGLGLVGLGLSRRRSRKA